MWRGGGEGSVGERQVRPCGGEGVKAMWRGGGEGQVEGRG